MRDTIRNEIPKAKEKISWSMPAFPVYLDKEIEDTDPFSNGFTIGDIW